MIYAKISDLPHYCGIHQNLDTAIHFLENADLHALTMGKNEVDGDRVFINRFNYETIPIESAAFEAHEHHLDIHLLLSGRERIAVGHMSRMQETGRDEVNDGIDVKGPIEQLLSMEPGKVLIVFPEDAHMVKIEWNGSCMVEKTVMKVKIN